MPIVTSKDPRSLEGEAAAAKRRLPKRGVQFAVLSNYLAMPQRRVGASYSARRAVSSRASNALMHMAIVPDSWRGTRFALCHAIKNSTKTRCQEHE
ncbi:MAG: hypothetical protein K2Y35_21860 [Burkholderiales bacterium]|nr:hypothetical protein [Burkholderiales bacterium]